jgi:excisionase family DNA binding protein
MLPDILFYPAAHMLYNNTNYPVTGILGMKDHKIRCQTYDVVSAGKILGIGRTASYQAAARGEIPTIRIGGKLRVPKQALEKLLDIDAVLS